MRPSFRSIQYNFMEYQLNYTQYNILIKQTSQTFIVCPGTQIDSYKLYKMGVLIVTITISQYHVIILEMVKVNITSENTYSIILFFLASNM